jgi:C_GCAxxG_C_C family probable redox protein
MEQGRLKDNVLAEHVRRRAIEIFNGKRANCAESVFRAVFEHVETPLPPEVSGLLTPLGGGIANRGENCGAMLAGSIAMGLVYGRMKPNELPRDEHRARLWEHYSLFNQLPHRFQEKFGEINCWNLTEKYTYGTKECRENCERIIGETVVMVIELLQEAKQKGLPFEFKKNIVTQATEKTRMTVEELIEYKKKGKPFPV